MTMKPCKRLHPLITLSFLLILGSCREAPVVVNYDAESAASKLHVEKRSIRVEPADETTRALFSFSDVNINVMKAKDGTPTKVSADSDILLRSLDWEIRYHKGEEILHTERVQGRRGNIHDFVDLRPMCDSSVLGEIPDRISIRLIQK